MQLLMQNDVRDQFLKAFPESDSLVHPGHQPGDNYYPSQILKMITDYFIKKKERIGKQYDSGGEINMFFITMIGFAMRSIYSDADDDEKAINRIIELFK